jgi:Predicted membrane protein (DUF2078).
MNIEKLKKFLNAIRYILIIVIVGITSWAMYDVLSARAPKNYDSDYHKYHQHLERLDYRYSRGRISQKEYNRLTKKLDDLYKAGKIDEYK